MKDKVFILAGIALMFALSGCPIEYSGTDSADQSTEASSRSGAATYTISGTVYTNDGGSPEGAHVQLRQNDTLVPGKTAVADSEGVYSISGVDEGDYSIEASLSRYDTGTRDNFSVSGNVTNIDITLEPSAAPSGESYTISGTISVSDSGTGGSSEEAQVQLRSRGKPVGSVVWADENGAYTISGVSTGSYSIEVSLLGYNTGTISSFTVSKNVTGKNITLTKSASSSSDNGSTNGTADDDSADNGTADNGTTGAGTDDTPVIAGSGVRGTITGSGNQPVVGARVVLVKSGGTETFGSAATTGSSGTYAIAISGIAAGQWVIKVTHEGYADGESTAFAVTGDANVTRDLRITPIGYTVSGVISTDVPQAPAVGAEVVLRNKSGGLYATIKTNNNGYYAIADVPTESGYYIEATLAGYDYQRSDSFNVNTSTTIHNLTLEKSRYNISGTISTDEGTNTRANGAKVELKQNGSVIATEYTVSSGDYEFEDVLAGTYTISVSLDTYATGTIGSFTLSDNATKDLKLTRARYSVSGTITTSDGGNVSGAQVQLSGSGIAPVTVNSSGAYTISGVVAGTYSVLVSLDGYDTGTAAAFTLSGNVTGKNVQLTPTIPGPVTYTITGTISLSDNADPKGARVLLMQGNTAAAPMVSAASSGAYTIKSVLPGTYTILVTHPGYEVFTSSSVTVSGSVAGKNFALTKLDVTDYYAVNGYISLKTGAVAVGTKVMLKQVGGASGAIEETLTGPTGYYLLKTKTSYAEWKVTARTDGTPYPTDSASVDLSLGVPLHKDVQETY